MFNNPGPPTVTQLGIQKRAANAITHRRVVVVAWCRCVPGVVIMAAIVSVRVSMRALATGLGGATAALVCCCTGVVVSDLQTIMEEVPRSTRCI